ncbi:MAG: hypothetical protein WA705_00615 [Candidatus Ozemobacteraceae bacterium]
MKRLHYKIATFKTFSSLAFFLFIAIASAFTSNFERSPSSVCELQGAYAKFAELSKLFQEMINQKRFSDSEKVKQELDKARYEYDQMKFKEYTLAHPLQSEKGSVGKFKSVHYKFLVISIRTSIGSRGQIFEDYFRVSKLLFDNNGTHKS